MKVAAILGGRLVQDESGQPGADKGAGGVRGVARLSPAGKAAICAYLDQQGVPLPEHVERVSHRLGQREAKIETTNFDYFHSSSLSTREGRGQPG